jgi:SAM-dependent methyltransferase
MVSWKKFFAGRLDDLARAGTVHDIGGGANPQDRARFRKYVLVDINEAYKPDIVADVQALPFADGSLEAVLCLEVLEHVEDPFRAVREIHRVLKPGGKVLASSPFHWPYHAKPGLYRDYWRFSADGMRTLFKPFASVEVVAKGGWASAMIGFIPFCYGFFDRHLRPPVAGLEERFLPGRRNNAPGHFVFAVK